MGKMSMFKKPIIAGICLVIICLFSLACDSNKPTDNRDNKELSLDVNEMRQINISTSPPLFLAFAITDKGQISTVANYLNSLNQIETKLNPNDYMGMAYNVKILLEDNTERVFILQGNKFFMEKGSFTYEIPYEEAIKFDIIVANILQINQSQSGEPSIVGTVISIKAAESGHNISCVIKDKDNETFDVYVNDAKIIDATGNGWMILHENDLIKVFYQNNTLAEAKPIVATNVYIQNAAQTVTRNKQGI